jgi:hypothetical protein
MWFRCIARVSGRRWNWRKRLERTVYLLERGTRLKSREMDQEMDQEMDREMGFSRSFRRAVYPTARGRE